MNGMQVSHTAKLRKHAEICRVWVSARSVRERQLEAREKNARELEAVMGLQREHCLLI